MYQINHTKAQYQHGSVDSLCMKKGLRTPQKPQCDLGNAENRFFFIQK